LKKQNHSKNSEDCCHFYLVGMCKVYIPHLHAFPFPLTGSWSQWIVPVRRSACSRGATSSRCADSELPTSRQRPWTGLYNRQGTKTDDRAWRRSLYL